MQLPDVNVLVYAYRVDAFDHQRYKQWLEDLVTGDEAYGLSELVLSGFYALSPIRGSSIPRLPWQMHLCS